MTALRAPSPLLLAMEGRAVFEWAACALSWPLLRRAPQGDGHPVIVLPGLIANDTSTAPLRRFLSQRGYRVDPWGHGFNFGPRGRILRGLIQRVRSLHRETGQKVSLLGWSLGGAMARALAVRLPQQVRSVITLGSPLNGPPKATNAWRVFEFVSGLSIEDPRLASYLSGTPEAPCTSILSKTDGVVNWRLSMLPEAPMMENIEVTSSHFGLGANPLVLWAIADRLAQAEGDWRPFERERMLRALLYRDPRRFWPTNLIAP